MQLLIILALLLYGGGNAQRLLGEVKPVLESIGGENMQSALKSAEQISEVLSAIQSFSAAGGKSEKTAQEEFTQKTCPAAYPLAPVSAIADREITYCLNKYIQNN